MKKNISIWILSIAASLFLSTGLLAQEQIEMSIKVTKDGKVVKDTSYQFDDAAEAKNAMKMMEVMSGDELHKEHVTYNYTTAHSGHGEAKTMVFISKDGETTEISELHGDSLVWVTEEEHDVVKKKEIKVMVSSDEEGNWTVVEGDEKMMDKDENVFIMKGDDVKVKVMKIMEEEGGGENVKVIVITENGDLHEDHDVDHDHDSDHDEEVEVKVVKKKEKK